MSADSWQHPLSSRIPFRLAGPCLFGIGLALIQPARADDPQPASTAQTKQLDTINVSARRHDEPDYSVPISLQAFTAEDLSWRISPGQSNASLARSVPNLSFVDLGTTYSNVFTIRGVGSFMPLSSDDSSVVVYLNDVPRAATGASPNLLDVERVEVLRGPQGTLFGRNTQGGAIQIIPNAPEFRRSFSTALELGEHGHVSTDVVANTPLADKLAMRLAVHNADQDGRIPNLSTGAKDGAVRVGAARASLLWGVDERTLVSAMVFQDQTRSSVSRFVWRENPAFPQIAQDTQTLGQWRDSGASVRLEHDFPLLKLTAVSSYQDSSNRQVFDLSDALINVAMTHRPAAVFNVPGADMSSMNLHEKTMMQELRLNAPADSSLQWTAGLNYFRSDFDNTTVARASPAAFSFVSTQNGRQYNRTRTGSTSLFGEANVPLAANISGIAGLRYTTEHKRASYVFDGNGSPMVVPHFDGKEELDANLLTGRLGLSHDDKRGTLFYATAARGASAPGYSALSTSSPRGKLEPAFPESSNWTYEAGFKSLALANGLGVRAAVFYNDVKNGHLVVFDPSQALLRPVSLDYRSQGAELELEAQATPRLHLRAGLGYTNGKLAHVPPQHLSGARSGAPLPNVPKYSVDLAADYTADARLFGIAGQLKSYVGWQFASQRSADIKQSFYLPGYALLNARLSWQHRNWNLYSYANNLANRTYAMTGQAWSAGVNSVRPGQGRELGLGVIKQF